MCASVHVCVHVDMLLCVCVCAVMVMELTVSLVDLPLSVYTNPATLRHCPQVSTRWCFLFTLETTWNSQGHILQAHGPKDAFSKQRTLT